MSRLRYLILLFVLVLFLPCTIYGEYWGSRVYPRKTKGIATLLVVASDATDAEKARADYQADGTNDTEINTAINSLTSGTVYLSSGTFNTSEDIMMKDGVNVFSVGYLATTVKTEAALSSNRAIFNFTNAARAVLWGVIIDGDNVAVSTYTHCGVYVSGEVAFSKVISCHIQNFDGTDSTPYEGQDGIYFATGALTNFFVTNCQIATINDDGADVNAAKKLRFLRNKIVDCKDCGVDSDNMDRSWICDNWFKNCDCLGGAGGGGESGAVELESGSGSGSDYNFVCRNLIEGTGDAEDEDEYGIYIEASNNNNVTDNQIITIADGSGIYLKGDSDDNVISNNLLNGCIVSGIKNDSGAQRNKFSSNHFVSCGANYDILDASSTPAGRTATFIWCDTVGLAADGYLNVNGGAASVFAADKGFVVPRDGCIIASTVTVVFSTETDTRTATFKVYEDGVDMGADIVITGDGTPSREINPPPATFVYGAYEFDALDVLSVYYDEDALGGMDWDDAFGVVEVQYYD